MTVFPYFPTLRDKRRFDRIPRDVKRFGLGPRNISRLFPARAKLSARQVFRCSPEIKSASRGHATEGRTLKNVFLRGIFYFFFFFFLFFSSLIFCHGLNVITKLPAAPRFGRSHEWYMTGISTNSPGKHRWTSFVSRQFVNDIFESFASRTTKL